MANRNVDTFKAAHQAFNKRKFDAVLEVMSDDIMYEDYPRGVTHRGRKAFKEFMQSWVSGFSNAEITEAKYIDGGDTVVAEFIARGTNDGSLGPMPKTGKTISLRMCEIVKFDAKGKIVSGRTYYDQATMMAQLGHMTPIGTAG